MQIRLESRANAPARPNRTHEAEPHSRGPLAILAAHSPLKSHSAKNVERLRPCALDGSVGSAVETLDVHIYAYVIPEWTIDIDGHMDFC